MLAVTLLGLWALLLVGRDTPVGKALHRLLVEMPCRRIAAIARGQVLLAILSLAIIVTLVWVLEDDGRMLVTMGWAEFMGLASAIDLSALLDLAAVAVLTAGTVRVRAIGTWVARRMARPRRQRSAARRPAGRRDDADDRPRWAVPLHPFARAVPAFA